MTGNCTLTGDLNLTGSALLHVSHASTFTLQGNIVLSGSAKLKVSDSTFAIANTHVFQYNITSYNYGSLEFSNSDLVTNSGAIQSSVPSTYSGRDDSTFTITGSYLDPARSWLLCETLNRATLTTTGTNFPSEIYLHDTSTVNVGTGSNHAVWLDFPSGKSGLLKDVRNTAVPSYYNFGRTTSAPSNTNVGYQLNINGGTVNLSIRSYPGSTVIVQNPPGSVVDYATFTIGLYLSSQDGGLTLSNLNLEGPDGATSLNLSSANRTLILSNARMSTFPWHIYGDATGTPVTINNSLVNELGAVSQGPVASELGARFIVNDTTFQFAAIAAYSPKSEIIVKSSQIHSQSILTHSNGMVAIWDSTIYGTLVQAMGSSRVYLLNSFLATNPPYIPNVQNGHNPLIADNSPLRYVTGDEGAIVGLGIDNSLPIFQAGGGGFNISGDGFIKNAQAAGLGSCTYELGYENTDGTGYLSLGLLTPSENRWTKNVAFGVPGTYAMVFRLTCPPPTGTISVKRPFTVVTMADPLTFLGATHTYAQCTAAGGTVVSVDSPAKTLCRFSSASCPSDWTQAENWSTTTAGTQAASGAIRAPSYVLNTGSPWCASSPNADNLSLEAISAQSTGGHAWRNGAIESATTYGSNVTLSINGNPALTANPPIPWAASPTSGNPKVSTMLQCKDRNGTFTLTFERIPGTTNASRTQIGCK